MSAAGTGIKRPREEEPITLERLIEALERKGEPVSQGYLMEKLRIGAGRVAELAALLQKLLSEKRVEMFQLSSGSGKPEILYSLIPEEKAAKLRGLSPEDTCVLGLIEKAGNQGVWVRNLKVASRLQQTEINKILRRLETRKLVKAVKSVSFKNRKMYMLYDLEPAKEVTGGVWYTAQQMDQEFISTIRKAIVRIMMEFPYGCTPAKVAERLREQGVAPQPLKPMEVRQVMDTLVYDGIIDYENAGAKRLKVFTKPYKALFPSAKSLPLDYMSKKDRKDREEEGGDDEDEEDDDYYDEEDDEDDEEGYGEGGGAGSSSGGTRGRRYVLLPHAWPVVAPGVPPAGAAAPEHGSWLVAHGIGTAEHTLRPASAPWVAKVPCGTCPVASQCTPGGVISPETCVYLSTWLQF